MKISVVGSINMDMSTRVDRLPNKGETITGSSLEYVPGGKGANQAVAMARLGAYVEMFGCVGADANGKALLKNLKNQGVYTEHIQVLEGVSTGVAMITVGEEDNTIVIIGGANEKVDCAYVDTIKNHLKESDLVILQHEIPEKTIRYVVDFCYENQISVLLNPAPARKLDEETVKKITYLTPNEHEAELIFNTNDFKSILQKYPEKLLITMGEKGVSTCLKNGEVLLVPARKTKVVDTTGAGDTLNGALAVKIAGGAGMEEAIRFANAAASLSIEKFGAQGGMPTYEEVVNVL